ncbi:MAG: hypothetical protein RL030_1757 [Pseudomonadota bacterium]|jgi:hypothetical protein
MIGGTCRARNIGHITPTEGARLLEHFGAAETIRCRNVTSSVLSIARHDGATINGKTFVYLPATDELIRDDALLFLRKLRKLAPIAGDRQSSLEL